MNLSPLQKLDKVLEILTNRDEKAARMIQIIHDANGEITYNNFDMIINKLMKDGYIGRPYDYSNPISDTIYSLTFEGLVFCEKGGYLYDFKNEKRKVLKDMMYIVAVGVGTALAGIYGLFEMTKWIFHHFHLHLPF